MEKMCLSFLWNFVFVLSIAVTISIPEVVFNSSLACTRGANQTSHELDCRKSPISGLVGQMTIRRVFFGTPPLTSGCDRTASSSKCCTRNPETDCLFENNDSLKEIVNSFSGTLAATFLGKRPPTPPEICDPNIYPSIASYSFIELACTSVGSLEDITSNVKSKEPGEVYLDSNNHFINTNVVNASFKCVAETECNSTVSFFALSLIRKVDSFGHCPEEFTFEDAKHPNITGNVTCAAGYLIFNETLFTSVSNVASLNMTVTGNHTGKVFIKTISSKKTASVSLSCGTEYTNLVANIQPCPEDDQIPLTSSLPESSTVGTSTTTTTTERLFPFINRNDSLSAGTIAGIVLAIIAIVLVLLLIIGIVVYKRRRDEKHKCQKSNEQRQTSNEQRQSNKLDQPPPYNISKNNEMNHPFGDTVSFSDLGHTYVTPTTGTCRSDVSYVSDLPAYMEPSGEYDTIDLEVQDPRHEYLRPSQLPPFALPNPNDLFFTNFVATDDS